MNGARPPDLSGIVNARAGHSDYVYSIITGFGQTPPAKEKMARGMYYNPYYPGHQIAMPPPLTDGSVTYADGTISTVDQEARDVVTFLAWAGDRVAADVAYDARQDRKRRYTSFSTAGSLAVPFDVVQERVKSFLEHRDPVRPLFLYINFHDTHYPYHRDGLRTLVSGDVLSESAIAAPRASALKNMYFNTAANVDAAIGATLDLITQRLGAPPAVIATADHGESLFDEGFLGHGYALNDVQTRIPLVVAGLPLTVEQPFGQSDLRDAVDAALAAGPEAGPPRLVDRPGKQVFQYLGRIERPRQIAFADATSRMIYDFRTRRVQIAGAWTRPEALTGQHASDFLRLITTWERMVQARAAAGADRSSSSRDR